MTDNEKLRCIIQRNSCRDIECNECPLESLCFGGSTSVYAAKIMLERNELVAAVWEDDKKHTKEDTLKKLAYMHFLFGNMHQKLKKEQLAKRKK